jgi:hypothetical protein
MRKNHRQVFLATAALVVTGATLTACWLHTHPVGYFDAEPIMGYHGAGDVLSVSGDSVSYHTCCGSARLGSLSHDDSNCIIRVPGSTWRISPGIFSTVWVDAENPTNRFILGRRFWRPATTGHDIRDN